MIIKNITKKVMVGKNAKACKSIFSKAMGLMFSKKPKTLVFIFKKEKIIPLHMLFVFFPIDILFLDKDKEIVEIKESLKPFSFYTPKKKAMYIIELPEGAIKETKTGVGDRIGFQEKSDTASHRLAQRKIQKRIF